MPDNCSEGGIASVPVSHSTWGVASKSFSLLTRMCYLCVGLSIRSLISMSVLLKEEWLLCLSVLVKEAWLLCLSDNTQ